MRLIKQSSTSYVIPFLLVSSSDHNTAVVGASGTVNFKVSKNGAAFTTFSGAITEVGSGWYAATPVAGDVSTLGPLLVHATAASSDPVDLQYQVVAFDPYTATNLGLSALPTASPNASGGLLLSHTASGQANLNLSQALSVSVTGDVVGGGLIAARAQGFGKWTLVGTVLTLYAADGTTPIKVFALDSAVSPTSRT